MKASDWLRASAAILPPILLLLAVAACASELQGGELPVAPVATAARGVARAGGEFRAASVAPGLRADFTPDGAAIRPASGVAWAFRATPWGLGCDAALSELGKAAPVTRGDRVTYVRPGLDEWYVRGPGGLEQGFTLHEPPPCRRQGVGVVIALGSGLGAVVAEGGRSARLHDAEGREVLRYTDLSVIDAAGRELPARLEARGEGLAIRFDDRSARYPVVVDPLIWTQQQQLFGVDPGGPPEAGPNLSNFGTAVALSGDTIVVGDPPAGPGQGAAHVFVRSGTTWTEQQRLTVKGDVPNFGEAVALNGDTAFVGAPYFGTSLGQVFVFTRASTTWTQQQALVPSDPSSLVGFGTPLAVSGSTLVVGQGALAPGTVHVYVLSGGGWSEQQILAVAGDAGSSMNFGNAVAVDGDTVVVGAPDLPLGTGSAYVFVRSGTTWTLEQALTAPDGAQGEGFGIAVAILGNTAIVGATRHLETAGALYVFTRSGSTWSLAQEIVGKTGAGLGNTIAMNSGTVMVGEGLPGPMSEIQAFAISGGQLGPPQTLTPDGPPHGILFGTTIAVDGTTAVAGAPGETDSSAFVFVLASPAGAPCTSSDTCATGSCVDGVCCTTASCPGAGPCNAAEHCQPGTGTCSVTPLHTGMPCPTDACTHDATCQAGICTGTTTVCPPADACHEFGACDPSNGRCSSPAKPDGAACPGGTCVAGVCKLSSAATMAPSGCGCGPAGAPAGGALGAGLALLLLARRRASRRTDAARKPSRG